MPIVLKYRSLNLLEFSGPVQACNGIALPLPYIFLLSVARSNFGWPHYNLSIIPRLSTSLLPHQFYFPYLDFCNDRWRKFPVGHLPSFRRYFIATEIFSTAIWSTTNPTLTGLWGILYWFDRNGVRAYGLGVTAAGQADVQRHLTWTV